MPSTLSKAVIASAVLGAVDASRGKIAGYSPGSKVTSHNAIDLDVKAMANFLGEATPNYASAKAVYLGGGNSKPYAEIVLKAGLDVAAAKKGKLTAKGTKGSIDLAFKDGEDAGETTIKVTYPISSVQGTYTACKGGALDTLAGSKATDPYVFEDNCIDEADPQLKLDDDTDLGEVVSIVNKGGRHLNGFSTAAYAKMYAQGPKNGCLKDKDRPTDGCPYDEYSKFYNYYGENYASKIVLAALDEGKTAYATHADDGEKAKPAGDMDFTGTKDVLRTQVAMKTAVYMSAYMYAIREFEDAIDDCQVGCHVGMDDDADDCNEFSTDSVHAWDEGVAFYTGTLEGTEKGGSSEGQLSYRLAEKRCGNFKTCGPLSNDLEGSSYVNTKLFQLIDLGQAKLLMGLCDETKPIVKEMVSLMSVPLIQGTLRYAYKVDKLAGGPEEIGEGAAFAAAIVPAVAACDAKHGKTIMDNMKVGAKSTSFAAVKAAFEACYDKMGIKCEEVGGLWFDSAGDYYSGAKPCPRSTPLPGEAKEVVPSWGVAVIAVVAALFGLTVIGFIVLVMKERAGTPIFLKLEKGGSRA